jgi:hypothetical protein
VTNEAARECGLLRNEPAWKKSFQITLEYLTICEGSLPACAVLSAYVFRAHQEANYNADSRCLELSEAKISELLCGVFDRKTIRKARDYLVSRRILIEDEKRGPHNARRCSLNRPFLRSLVQGLGPGRKQKSREDRHPHQDFTSVVENVPTVSRAAGGEIPPSTPRAVGENRPTDLENPTQLSRGNSPNGFIGSKNSTKNTCKNAATATLTVDREVQSRVVADDAPTKNKLQDP